MSNGGGSKWICEFCTYENYPAAKKCTMCFKCRTPELISDTINEEQDIYKMAPLVLPSPSSSDANNSSPDNSKWACEACTYLNWAKSTRCVQCLNPKRRSSPSSTRSQDNFHQHLTINTSDICQGEIASALRISPNSGSNNPSSNSLNIENRSGSSSPHGKMSPKWTCISCTYENWPRSLKCVICGIHKDKPGIERSPASQTLLPSTTFITTSCGIASRSHDSLISSLSNSPTLISSSGMIKNRKSPIAAAAIERMSELQAGGASASPLNVSSTCGSLRSPGSRSSPSPPQAREKRILMLRSKLRDSDWLWLNACMGAVDGDMEAIHAFIAAGGQPSRQLTVHETELLNRPSAFQPGYTLVHLAIRFHREDILAVLLTVTESASKATKRLPCMACPDMATDIRRQMFSCLRQRKGEFPCHFFTDCVTFCLPADIEDLSRHVQDQLFDETLDRDVQNELEVEEAIINWSMELTEDLGSRLYALWNRTAGDCLLDSILQATWGVFDVDNSLRRALADSLKDGAMKFYQRWKEYESMQAESLHFSLDESQWQHDWAIILSLASQPGASLEQFHIFALAHILRRPIIVYGVKYVKSFRGETLGFAKFQGVYLPLLWDSTFCWKNPVSLGYTRGHFSALVPMEGDTDDGDMGGGAGANTQSLEEEEEQTVFLPLVDCQGQLLQLHFLSGQQMGKEESVFREWLHCQKTKGGLLVATQRLGRRPLAAKQMVDEWMDHYRQLQNQPNSGQRAIKGSNFSSDGESDDE